MADYTTLFFNKPDCEACEQLRAQLPYKGLYDLRGIPCLYLLDRHKRVLYKGATTAITAALHCVKISFNKLF